MKEEGSINTGKLQETILKSENINKTSDATFKKGCLLWTVFKMPFYVYLVNSERLNLISDPEDQ